MLNQTYYWGDSDITVKFCEPKYQTFSWIAEYENTASAGSYVLVGIYFLFTKLQKVGMYILFLGISTIIMHTTLRYYGQWFDEASMLLISFEAIIKLKKNVPRYLLPMILAFYTYFSDIFIVFGCLFASFQLVIVYLASNSINYHNPKQRILIKTYATFFIISAIFWFLDQFYCDYIYNKINGHAVWHVGTAISMFFGFTTFLIKI